MKYLITTNKHTPFLTQWYMYDNHFNADLEMVVYDLETRKYTVDGLTWQDIEIDHL